jgi:hypothetical protein
VQAGVHAHVGVAAIPVEDRLDCRAGRGQQRWVCRPGGRCGSDKVDDVHDATALALARVRDAPLATVRGAQHARVARLPAAERVEDGAVEDDACFRGFNHRRVAVAEVGVLLEERVGDQHDGGGNSSGLPQLDNQA